MAKKDIMHLICIAIAVHIAIWDCFRFFWLETVVMVEKSCIRTICSVIAIIVAESGQFCV